MAFNPANLQGVVPVSVSQSIDRMSLIQINSGQLAGVAGGQFDFDPASTFALWVLYPDPANIVPVFYRSYVPVLPILWSASGGAPYGHTCIIQFCQADWDALGVFMNQNVQYQLLVSKDGGDTAELVMGGVVTLNGAITTSFS